MTTMTTPFPKHYAYRSLIREDHRQLWLLLNDIRGLCASDDSSSGDMSPGGYDLLVSKLETLRDDLAMHFATEEAGGPFREKSCDSDSVRRFDRFRQEHTDLYQEIATLADLAASELEQDVGELVKREIIDRFHTFDARLIAHETRESAVLFSD